jgi:hypothetical protein
VALDEEIAGWLSASVHPPWQISVRQLRTLSSRPRAELPLGRTRSLCQPLRPLPCLRYRHGDPA